jgi:dihydrofolate synthase/folylpolyglutamate synthase
MRYTEAFDYLNSFTNYEKTPGIDRDLSADGLERFRLLLRLLGRPNLAYPSIHVAGTKGKGSVCAMLDSMLREAGYRVGFYSSPHLHTFRERIRVDGEIISVGDMVRLVETLQPVVERIRALGDPSLMPTTYELATALAFLYFHERQVDIAVLEVGLGGRLDATNVVDPVVSVITSISLDHMEVLGDTIAEIAGEKAGIIKPHGRVVSAPQVDEARRVLVSVAEDRRASLRFVGQEIYVASGHLPEIVLDEQGVPEYQAFTIAQTTEGLPEKIRVKMPLLGSHQQVNAAVAVAAIREARLSGIEVPRHAIQNGLAKCHWPARMEIVRKDPPVVVDGAHNVDSFIKLGQSVADLFQAPDAIVVVGFSRDKNIGGILEELRSWTDGITGPTIKRLIVTRSRHPRGADAAEVAHQAGLLGLPAESSENTAAALDHAEQLASEANEGNRPPVIIVAGSLFVAAEAREHYGRAPDLSEEQS